MNDLPATDGAFDTTCGTDGLCDGVGPLLVPRSDGFVAIYSEDLQDTLALTYLGGSYHESIRSVALGADGDIYVTGETASVDFPTAGVGADTDCGIDGACDPTGPYDPTADGFVARLSADLSQLEYGSYLGGSGEDRPLVDRARRGGSALRGRIHPLGGLPDHGRGVRFQLQRRHLGCLHQLDRPGAGRQPRKHDLRGQLRER